MWITKPILRESIADYGQENLSRQSLRARRGRKTPFGLLFILVLAPLLLRSAVGELSGPNAAAVSNATGVAPGTFTFAAAGDLGASSANTSLTALDRSGVAFYLALGDLDYDQTLTDEAWCDYVKQRLPTLGPSFPSNWCRVAMSTRAAPMDTS